MRGRPTTLTVNSASHGPRPRYDVTRLVKMRGGARGSVRAQRTLAGATNGQAADDLRHSARTKTAAWCVRAMATVKPGSRCWMKRRRPRNGASAPLREAKWRSIGRHVTTSSCTILGSAKILGQCRLGAKNIETHRTIKATSDADLTKMKISGKYLMTRLSMKQQKYLPGQRGRFFMAGLQRHVKCMKKEFFWQKNSAR